MSEPIFDSADAYWERVGHKVLGEVERRLDMGEGDGLPGTLLMRLAEQYLKYLERKAKEAESEEAEYLTPLEAIDQEGLPLETKIEILTTYMQQLQDDHEKATAKLAELTTGGANEAEKVQQPAAP